MIDIEIVAWPRSSFRDIMIRDLFDIPNIGIEPADAPYCTRWGLALAVVRSVRVIIVVVRLGVGVRAVSTIDDGLSIVRTNGAKIPRVLASSSELFIINFVGMRAV